MGLLGQWLNFKLFGITYLVGTIKFKFFFQGPLAEWVGFHRFSTNLVSQFLAHQCWLVTFYHGKSPWKTTIRGFFPATLSKSKIKDHQQQSVVLVPCFSMFTHNILDMIHVMSILICFEWMEINHQLDMCIHHYSSKHREHLATLVCHLKSISLVE